MDDGFRLLGKFGGVVLQCYFGSCNGDAMCTAAAVGQFDWVVDSAYGQRRRQE
eukprot:CAMPEP_0201893044 /NCGR_PEP_ID=MMETSP0902-20130614/37843_1 /ASSEMBLY_ACC=CAM_ASM_000551 /TAXON_ID=420261 /ORGANISM="Thalassiosira antarctica, Strain CCMP982" /LENGTH=52 /DNA_ID=CAMNT_0048424717 /DNA_START=375 /DNA_END=533 /DNA_ORIENTATION=-